MDSTHYPRPAPRPAWSVPSHAGWARAGMGPLDSWRPMLASAFATGVFPAPGGGEGAG
ncbi:hypothetical protein H8R17_20080 [Streptomyces sp. TRM68367]|nr:hypothetical protein [Streptomyces sp. TRM68367]